MIRICHHFIKASNRDPSDRINDLIFPAGVFPSHSRKRSESAQRSHHTDRSPNLSAACSKARQQPGCIPTQERKRSAEFPSLGPHHDLVPLSQIWKLMRFVATGGTLEQQHNVQQMKISLLQRLHLSSSDCKRMNDLGENLLLLNSTQPRYKQ